MMFCTSWLHDNNMKTKTDGNSSLLWLVFCKRHLNSKSWGAGGAKTEDNVLPLCSETNSCHFMPSGYGPCFCSQFPPLFQPRCYLLSVCNMLFGTLRITSIHFTKKKKEERTHAASLSSLGKDKPCKFHDHSMLLLPILSLWLGFTWTPTEAYGIHLLWHCFCLILTVSMKHSRRRFILWVSSVDETRSSSSREMEGGRGADWQADRQLWLLK